MTLREAVFDALTFIAGALAVVGVAELSSAAGWIAAGVTLGGWTWLVLSEVSR